MIKRFVNLANLSPSIKLDIRYARKDNFINRAVYPSAHAFLLDHVASDLLSVHEALADEGFGLLIFDGYRPWTITKLFWDLSDKNNRQYLADPAKGSVHNRACAVDLSMFELKSGRDVQMPSEFDEMNEKSHMNYLGGDRRSRELRDLLQQAMTANQFTGIKNEWWHFNHVSHLDYPVMDHSFEAILNSVTEIS